jgi:hypothetical protein
VISQHSNQQQQLQLEPPEKQQTRIHPEQRDTEQGGKHGANRHDGEQAFLHEGETSAVAGVASLGVIDEQPRQIKEPRKPRHHECDVQGLEPDVIRCRLHRDRRPGAGNFRTRGCAERPLSVPR